LARSDISKSGPITISRNGPPVRFRATLPSRSVAQWRLCRVAGHYWKDEIYVTSMARVKHPAAHGRFAREAKPQFLAGSLFRITGLGIRGVPEPRFAG